MDELDKMIEANHARSAAKRAAMPDTWPCDRHGPYPSNRNSDTVQFGCPKCAAEADAEKAAWCQAWAIWTRWQDADVPPRYRNRTFANWQPRTTADSKILTTIRDWFDRGNNIDDLGGLVLAGGVGLGKTHLACALIAEAVRAGCSARYATLPDVLTKLRASYHPQADLRTERVLARLTDADVLVLDEVGATRGSDWEQQTISALIDDRYRNGGAIVLCTNALPAALPQFIGERAADRFNEFGLTLILQGASYRSLAPNDKALRDAPPAIIKPPDPLKVSITTSGGTCARTFTRDNAGKVHEQRMASE